MPSGDFIKNILLIRDAIKKPYDILDIVQKGGGATKLFIKKRYIQAGAELGQAQLKLKLGFTLSLIVLC